MKNEIENIFNKSNIALTSEQLHKFLKFEELMIQWNQKINITSITESHEIYIKHFLDSIIVTKFFKLCENDKIIDVGTGGGFPGIPLKIMFNDIEITLLDSLNKRLIFLQEVINNLKLNKIELLHGRAEDYGINLKYREQYDISISRAVASLNVLSEYCIPFVKKGGIFISLKSGNIEEELKESEKAIKLLGGRIVNVQKYLLPNTDISRSIIIIEKIENTLEQYPRKAGKPSKKPL